MKKQKEERKWTDIFKTKELTFKEELINDIHSLKNNPMGRLKKAVFLDNIRKIDSLDLIRDSLIESLNIVKYRVRKKLIVDMHLHYILILLEFKTELELDKIMKSKFTTEEAYKIQELIFIKQDLEELK